MEISNCQFCNVYVTNLEIHYCKNFGNKRRQCNAIIPQNSDGNLAQNIDLRTEQQLHYEARSSPMNEINISRQQSILSNIHQPIYCKETKATEMVSQYSIANMYGCNPETSNILFPAMHPFQENEPNSTHLQMPSEASKVFINQNLKNFHPSNSEQPPNNHEPCFLPGFQETFSQRNKTINPRAKPSNASSQMAFLEMSRTNEMSHFSSVCPNFDETDSTLTNRISQFPETSVETPILATQNAQYNPMGPIPQPDFLHQTESFPSFDPLICDIPSKNRSTSGSSLCGNRESNIFNLYETGNPHYFTDYISLPSTSQVSMQNRESHAAKLCAVKINEDKNTSKDKHGTDFSYGMDDSVSYTSSTIHTQQRNSGCGIIYSSTEPRAWECSSAVTYSSETYNACNIYNSTTAKESSVNCKEPSPDKPLSGNSSVFKTHLDAPLKKPKKELYTCSKCPKQFFRKDYLESHERHHNVERPYVCYFCDSTFTRSYNLREHIRTHTGEKPFQCMHCGKCFTQSSGRSYHIRVSHTGGKTDP
ncbi:hypothetical protein CEXT_222981 [Caerostris extrusa]|uniref:C2H2-type domain-containing protein n=1 Tax=Caerostris extrusa TaxID=172846 RepID=A0AAV4U711_CAEEX|nr:hypothetical protein CEXT_222981 [Caerostris extrusa]